MKDALLKFLRCLLFLALALPVLSCASSEPQLMPGQSPEWAAYERDVARLRTPAELFPSATTVKVYAGRLAVRASPDGRVTASDYGLGDSFNNEAAPMEGGTLTGEELNLLRRSVSWIPSPPAVLACCIPRHVFTFFDAKNGYLGSLAVCFQCKCARLQPGLAPPNSRVLSLDWDVKSFAKIVEAHGLRTDPQNIPR